MSIISKAILDRNEGIEEVKQPENFTAIIYSKENLQKLDSLLTQGELTDLKGLPVAKMDDEMIVIVAFMNQDNKRFFATVYDNSELWQNPVILNIYPVNNDKIS